MFTLTSTHRREIQYLQARLMASELARKKLLGDWNQLVRNINAKGGETFLNGQVQKQLDGEDIKRLLMLCHPDKHGGKKMAEEMTQKLLALRTVISNV